MITKTHHAQSDINLAIINFVEARGRSTYAALFEQFRDENDNEVNAHPRFSKKLEYLVFIRRLESTGRGRGRVFTLGAEAADRPASAASVARDLKAAEVEVPEIWEKFCADTAPGQRAQAPSINVMATDYPLYTSRLAPPVRPGALNHLSYATRGDCC